MSTTTINIRIADEAEAVRKRVSAPQSDLLFRAWWDSQDKPSLSVRMLIHEEIATHGLTDRVNRIGASAVTTATAPATAADSRNAELAALRQELADLKEKVGPLLPFVGLFPGRKCA